MPATPFREEPPSGSDATMVSVVMPCLNEADTVAACINKAKKALAESGIAGEVIVGG